MKVLALSILVIAILVLLAVLVVGLRSWCRQPLPSPRFSVPPPGPDGAVEILDEEIPDEPGKDLATFLEQVNRGKTQVGGGHGPT